MTNFYATNMKKTILSKQAELEAIMIFTVANFGDSPIRVDGVSYDAGEYIDLRMSHHESNGYKWANEHHRHVFNQYRSARINKRTMDWLYYGVELMCDHAKHIVSRSYDVRDSVEACMAAYVLRRHEEINTKIEFES